MESMRTHLMSKFLPVVTAIGLMAAITVVTAFGIEPETLPVAETPTSAEAPSELSPESIGEFAIPVEVMSRPNDDRTFVVELGGRVVAAEADQDEHTVILDIVDQTITEGEHGLLGAAFHPTEDYLYVHFSDEAGRSVIAEFEIDPETAVADVASQRQVLVVDQPYNNHNGGELAFGPDGFVYLGLGDGGLADDPDRSALDLSSRLGKILRFDPRPDAAADSPFSVPEDNPFVDTDDADPTVWSYGLRNPWRFSFDQTTGDLWIADVGQDQFEEINVATEAGMSFGWSAFEGRARFNIDQPSAGHTDPYLTYERTEGNCSISGGAVYRGESEPGLDGWYLYGDYCSGLIWGFDTEAPGDPEIVELAQVDGLVAIAIGGDDEIYAVSVMGGVYRLT